MTTDGQDIKQLKNGLTTTQSESQSYANRYDQRGYDHFMNCVAKVELMAAANQLKWRQDYLHTIITGRIKPLDCMNICITSNA